MRAFLARAGRARQAAGWGVLAFAGLLLGVVAIAPAPVPVGPGDGPERLLLELPRSLVTVAVAAGTLALLLFFALALSFARMHGHEERVRRALWGMVFFPLLIAFAAIWHGGALQGLLPQLPGPGERPPAVDGASTLPTVSVPLFTAAVGALVLGVAFASLGVVGWMLLGAPLAQWRSASASARPPGPLAGAVEESLEDLRLEADARRAVIRCYARFEQALAQSRVPRAPWQTPLEFMVEALGRLPLPADAVRGITRLFELARFSEEPLGPGDRQAAWEALLAIRESLEAERDVAPGAPLNDRG